MNQILILKTNVDTPSHVKKIDALFKNIEEIKDWSIDLEDCDRVLRVVFLNIPHLSIEKLLTTSGIYCKHMASFDHNGILLRSDEIDVI